MTERKPRVARWLAVAALLILWAVWASPAPATVAEQRARLPPPAECRDPIAGTWKSHKYNPEFGDWESFTLRIERDPANPQALHGTLENRSWQGGPNDAEAGQCIGMNHWIVSMDGIGTYGADGSVHFGGVGQWRLDRVLCGSGPYGYNLDQFSGVIDPALQEFQSVNNDGGRAVNIPTVFRRIACGTPPASPHVNPVPPPFFPSGGGCSCR